jgi:iron-sulfur cluster assembly protein
MSAVTKDSEPAILGRISAFSFYAVLYNLGITTQLDLLTWSTVAMAITLTERAAKEVQKILVDQKMEAATLLRVGVAGGGCSGFQYALGFDTNYDTAKDSKYDQHGVSMVVDKKSALYLDGTTIDFYEGLEKRGFTFENPNATKTCGCGSSFQA